MGNCQAIDAATLEIQHPCGKVDKLYWSVCASEIMKLNPGHYVALLISTTLCQQPPPPNTAAATAAAAEANNSVKVTRIKLLRPTDTLVLGQVYRLITNKEVMKVLSAKKHAKMMKRSQQEGGEIRVEHVHVHEQKQRPLDSSEGLEILRRSAAPSYDLRKLDSSQGGKHERNKQKTVSSSSSNSSLNRGARTWQPSLQSISEAAS